MSTTCPRRVHDASLRRLVHEEVQAGHGHADSAGGAGGAGELLEAAEGWTILASVQPADEGRTLGDMIRRASSGGTDSGGGGGGDSGDGPLRGAETCALPRGASRLEAPQAVRVGSTRFELFEIAVW